MPSGPYPAAGNAGCATLRRSSSPLSNIGARPAWGFDQSATRTMIGPTSGIRPGRNRANVVAQSAAGFPIDLCQDTYSRNADDLSKRTVRTRWKSTKLPFIPVGRNGLPNGLAAATMTA